MDFHIYFHNVPDPLVMASLARIEKGIADLQQQVLDADKVQAGIDKIKETSAKAQAALDSESKL